MTVGLPRTCILLALFGSGIHRSWGQDWIGTARPSTHCLPRSYTPKDTDYESWINDYKTSFTSGNINLDLNREPIELAITIIDGDDLESDDKFASCTMRTWMFVFARGTISWQRVTPLGIQSGGPSNLAPEDLKVLRSLIDGLRAHLPDDYSELAPPGRRLVLQVRKKNDGVLAGVYDRANLPDSILEILGLTGATTGPMIMSFPPTATGTEEEVGFPPDPIGLRRTQPRDAVTHVLRPGTVTLAVSSDRSLVVERRLPFDGRLIVTDTTKSAVVLDKPDYTVDRRWIYCSHAWFSPDGRFLLLLSNLPAIYIYDTASWQQMRSLPGLPTDAVAYYPSSDWKRGVAVSRDGETSLWNAVSGQKLATLDLDGELSGVSFSPDNSLVAVTNERDLANHQPPNQQSVNRQRANSVPSSHLRIWETKSGHFLREMRPLSYFAHSRVRDPIWWGQGKYILAENREGEFGSEVVYGIWNVESGKFRGGLSGCARPGDPSFPSAISGERLFRWCWDHKIVMWDVANAVNKIAQFENQ